MKLLYRLDHYFVGRNWDRTDQVCQRQEDEEVPANKLFM